MADESKLEHNARKPKAQEGAADNPGPPAQAPGQLLAHPHRSARQNPDQKLAAPQAGLSPSAGARIAEGSLVLSLNPKKLSLRLLGVAEARALNQEPNAAGQLYRELIAPYEPVPALLALHFQDLARLELELQTWERIRDAQLEHRAQQNALEVRRRYREMDRELRATAAQVLESGLHRLPDSPGKFKKQIECLEVLKAQLLRSDFGAMRPALRQLYGNKFDPDYERAQLIAIDCRRLMEAKGKCPLSEAEFEELLGLVEEELKDATEGYDLQLDERTMTGSACLARLATRDEQWMEQQGDRLRRALDRAKAMTPKLLATLGLAEASSRSRKSSAGPDEPEATEPKRRPGAKKFAAKGGRSR